MKRGQHDANDTLATIPWKWRDWRASKARAVMTPEARGVYRELLDACWGEPDCALPNDDETLAGLAGVPLEYWRKVRAQVLAWFDESDGRLKNPRALYEWKRARAFRAGKRRAGRKGGKAKADKRKAEQPLLQQKASTAKVLPVTKSAPPSPSPSPTTTTTTTPPTEVVVEEDRRPLSKAYLSREARARIVAEGEGYLDEIMRRQPDGDRGWVLRQHSTPNGGRGYLIALDRAPGDEHLTRTVHNLRATVEKLKATDPDAATRGGLLTEGPWKR